MENVLLYLTYSGFVVAAFGAFGLLCWLIVKVVKAITG